MPPLRQLDAPRPMCIRIPMRRQPVLHVSLFAPLPILLLHCVARCCTQISMHLCYCALSWNPVKGTTTLVWNPQVRPSASTASNAATSQTHQANHQAICRHMNQEKRRNLLCLKLQSSDYM